MKRFLSFLILVLLALSLMLNAFAAQPAQFAGKKLRIAVQYGMQYAPVYVAQQLGLLEEALPGIELEWSNFAGGSALNEALISGALDVAFMGIPPALIAIDKGVDYRIAWGICVPPAEVLVTEASGIKTLKDIKVTDKIAVPGVGSIQHIMLAIAAQKQLGNANALDNSILAMANPDAYASLISGTDIVGHFASMPYIDLEAKAGMNSILTAEDALGSGASIICVTTPKIANDPDLYPALRDALAKSIALINAKDEAAVKIIAEKEKIIPEAAVAYLDWPGTLYAMEVYSISALGQFMSEAGYIKNGYPGFDKFTWPGAVEAKFD